MTQAEWQFPRSLSINPPCAVDSDPVVASRTHHLMVLSDRGGDEGGIRREVRKGGGRESCVPTRRPCSGAQGWGGG